MRILRWYVNAWDAKDKDVRKVLEKTELWFVPVMNPDGYQYTFQSPDTRLWRKNLRDNNGNGTTEVGDGVDPNRNYPEHWNYDEEGSSSIPSSDTYRGPSAGSEPETQAMMSLLDKVKFAFQVNFHSYGPYLLYPEGWQIGTPTADDPIYYALSGNLSNPAIPDFYPGTRVGRAVRDERRVDRLRPPPTTARSPGRRSWRRAAPAAGSCSRTTRRSCRPSSRRCCRSRRTSSPRRPTRRTRSPTSGIQTKPFYLESDDTFKAGLPLANFKFAVSYGDPQTVRVLALRDLGKVELKYRINGGKEQSGTTDEYNGGERYGGKTDVYYHVVEGQVKGTKAGDSVEVWFEAKKVTSPSFTYHVASTTQNKVLVVAAEDYSGASPVQTPGPHYLQYYLDALAANGIQADVYDVDANGRTAPDDLGVLSHYKAVIWYTGDDTVTREPGWGAGNASRLAMDEMLDMREYMNEGGRVLLTGKNAGAQFTPALGTQLYDPTAANAQCRADPAVTAAVPRAVRLGRRGRTTCSSTGSAPTSSTTAPG